MANQDEVLSRLVSHVELLYPDEGKEALAERCRKFLSDAVERVDGKEAHKIRDLWDEKTSVVITYGDTFSQKGAKPLAALKAFVDRKLRGSVDCVHILPFFPWSSDDGFSVIDYLQVDPKLGTWDGVDAISEHFASEDRPFFIEVADPSIDLSAVVRPRALPLLTPVETVRGERFLWTTFSDDQFDLNYKNPDVLFAMLDVLLHYVEHGARIIRLDAIAFLWKEVGTSCLHLPQTHEIVKLMRDVLEIVAPHVVVLTETNVPFRENISYFGVSSESPEVLEGNEAHMVYQFTLPPLLLHTFHTEQATVLRSWASSLASTPLPPKTTFLNFTASHDGVGIRGLEGIVSAEEVEALIGKISERGGLVSTRHLADGTDVVYELNTTWFDALAKVGPKVAADADDIARFLSSQAIALALRGVPAVYVSSLFGARNYVTGVEERGYARAINREKFDLDALLLHLDEGKEPGEAARDVSHYPLVFRSMLSMMQCRSQEPAFHPDIPQAILLPTPQASLEAVFAIRRGDHLYCLTNVSGHRVALQLSDLGEQTGSDLRCILSTRVEAERPTTIQAHQLVHLQPYETQWLLATPAGPPTDQH